MRTRTIVGIALAAILVVAAHFIALVWGNPVIRTYMPYFSQIHSSNEKICEDTEQLIADLHELEREYREVDVPVATEINTGSHAACPSNATCDG